MGNLEKKVALIWGAIACAVSTAGMIAVATSNHGDPQRTYGALTMVLAPLIATPLFRYLSRRYREMDNSLDNYNQN